MQKKETNNRDPFAINDEQKSQERLVGAYVSQPMYEYLTLLAVYHNATITSTFRRMIEYWSENEEPEENIMRILANRAYNEWCRRCMDNKDKSGWISTQDKLKKFREYENKMKDKLRKRKVSEPKITAIIQDMEMQYGIGGTT